MTARFIEFAYLVSIMGSGGSALALVTTGEFGQITVVVTLPVDVISESQVQSDLFDIHLVVEDFGLPRLRLGNEGLVKDVKNILADPLKLKLDLLTVVADDADVLIRALLLLLLLDRGDDAPRGTTGTDDVLVRDREEIAFVHSKFAGDLEDGPLDEVLAEEGRKDDA